LADAAKAEEPSLRIHRRASSDLLPIEPNGSPEGTELLHPMSEQLESQYQSKT